jgi:4-hydroxy-tetrahydrodipicolinate synthase
MYTERLESRIQGVGALVLTIFDEELNLNLGGMGKNIRYMIDNGVTAENGFLVTNGSTGECYAMSMEERKQVIKETIDVANGQVPVVAGCNDTNVFNVIELVNYSAEMGAEAAMIIQPYYLPFNENQMYSFFEFIDSHVDLPIMIYNNPMVASNSEMSIGLLRKLAQLKNVFALKETTSSIKRFFHTQVLTDELLVFAGSSSLQPFGSLAGMSGFISFLSSFNPKLQVKLWKAIKERDWEKAQSYHTEELKIYDWWWSGGITQTFGQVVHAKKALDLLGLVGGTVRPPLVPIDEETTEGLKAVLKSWGLL